MSSLKSLDLVRSMLGVFGSLSIWASAQAASLASVISNWPESHLQASLEPEGRLQVEQGGTFQVKISADQEANVLLVLVNSESMARLIAPHREGTQDRVTPGTEMRFPEVMSGETLYANMPLGSATLYVLASSEALVPLKIDNDASWTPLSTVEAQINGAVKAKSGIRVALVQVPLRVVSAKLQEFVSTEDFVQFFGIATRGLSNAERGFAVEFAHDSADLTDWGKRQLDAVGKGMTDARLSNDRFLIEGHTDDTGTDDYNLSLSKRRAISVGRYLHGVGVEPDRLRESGVGKAGPAMPGISDAARQANRRVVIRRLDSKD
jgi:outer membrane protein OmpA-like peptidoglycan-associated protein